MLVSLRARVCASSGLSDGSERSSWCSCVRASRPAASSQLTDAGSLGFSAEKCSSACAPSAPSRGSSCAIRGRPLTAIDAPAALQVAE